MVIDGFESCQEDFTPPMSLEDTMKIKNAEVKMKSQEVIDGEKELAEAQAWIDSAWEKLELAQEEYQHAIQNMVIVRG